MLHSDVFGDDMLSRSLLDGIDTTPGFEWRETTVQHAEHRTGGPRRFCFAFDQLRVKGHLLK
jgi:hypothetical protein